MFRIDRRQIHPALMLPTSDMSLKDAFPRQVGNAAKVTRINELVLLVSPISTEDLSVRIVGKPDRGIEHMLFDIDLGL